MWRIWLTAAFILLPTLCCAGSARRFMGAHRVQNMTLPLTVGLTQLTASGTGNATLSGLSAAVLLSPLSGSGSGNATMAGLTLAGGWAAMSASAPHYDVSTFEGGLPYGWSGTGGNGNWGVTTGGAHPPSSYGMRVFFPPQATTTATTSRTYTATLAGNLDFWYRNWNGYRLTVTVNGVPTTLPDSGNNVWAHSTTVSVPPGSDIVISFSGSSNSGISLSYEVDDISVLIP